MPEHTRKLSFKAAAQLVIATHNHGKLKEFQPLLATPGLELVTARELGLPEPEETEPTFVGNAKLKALAAAKASGLPAFAEDSGFEVSDLDGYPGVYSARVAGPSRNYPAIFQKIKSDLTAKNISADGAPASFVAVVALAWPDGHVEIAEGRVNGRLAFPPRGTNGFAYDPLFVPKGETRTFAEMTLEDKRRFSHRARAIAALKTQCFP